MKVNEPKLYVLKHEFKTVLKGMGSYIKYGSIFYKVKFILNDIHM